MAAFTSERRMAENRALIPQSGDRRRAVWSYGKHENRDPISGAPPIAGRRNHGPVLGHATLRCKSCHCTLLRSS